MTTEGLRGLCEFAWDEWIMALRRAGHLRDVSRIEKPAPALDERPAQQLHSNVGPSEGQETDREPNRPH